MKNKFYSALLLWLGLAFASTAGYAKPAHLKHSSVAAKGVKMTTRHSAARKKPAITPPVESTSNTRKRTILRAGYGPGKSVPLMVSRDILLTQETQDDSYAPTENERIHSSIAARHLTSTHGVVNTSLMQAGQTAGLSEELILQLANIFAWDIDFAGNLHQGDQFTVVYEESRGNNHTSDSQIVAAEFINQGRILTAIRYKDDEGQVNYYSPEGKPMRKAFLSTPVDFVRISSGFDTQRKHPILNKIRAHKGVDYAASEGTPVKSAGDGEVVFCGS